MKKKAIITVLIVLIAIAGVVFWYASNNTDRVTEIVKIGAVLPLTGDMASYATQLKKGMDLAVELNNAKNKNKKIEVIYEDDMGDANKAVSAFRKLVDMNRVQMIIGGMFSTSTFAMAPLAEKEGIVLLSPTASAMELTNAGDYIFRIYPSDSYDGLFLSNFAFNHFSARKIAIIYEQVASITAISNAFKENFASLGGQIVYISGYNSSTNDFRTLLQNATKYEPDIIFIPGNINTMSTLLIQAKQIGIKSKFITISTFFDKTILDLTKDASEGVIFSTPMFDPNTDSPSMHLFVQKYKEKYGVEADILGGYGYDVINISLLAISNGNEAKSIKNSLYNIKDFPGVTGNTTFDENGDVVKELRMMTVTNGKFELFQEKQNGKDTVY